MQSGQDGTADEVLLALTDLPHQQQLGLWHWRLTRPLLVLGAPGSGRSTLVVSAATAALLSGRGVHLCGLTPPAGDSTGAAAGPAASPEEIFEYIKSVSYPNAKAKHLIGMARMIVNDFGGELPNRMEDLIKLPGVGRKTANVLQAVWFGKATMAVDTHVYRVSHRLGLVPKTADTPYKVEQELIKNIPEVDIPNAHHWLLLHGRYICTSRMPHCADCPFDSFCPKLFENSKLK